MRRRIALHSTSCEMHGKPFLFRGAFGVRTRPRVAFPRSLFHANILTDEWISLRQRYGPASQL
jgi:hypothetical protein